MEFKNINDWNKRKELVDQYINLRNELKDRFIAERMGDEYKTEEYMKQFKPLTDDNKRTQELLSITNDEIKKIKNIKVSRPMLEEKPRVGIPSIPGYFEGTIATDHIDNVTDRDNGVYSIKRIKDGKLKIGERDDIIVRNNNVIIPLEREGEEIKIDGTPRLWELLTKKEPKEIDYNDKDDVIELEKY